MFAILTTDKGEDFIVNLDHVLRISDGKKGVCVDFDDESFFYVKETFDEVLKKISNAVVLTTAEFRQLKS